MRFSQKRLTYLENVVNKPKTYFHKLTFVISEESAFISDFFEKVNYEKDFLLSLKTSLTEGASALFKHENKFLIDNC